MVDIQEHYMSSKTEQLNLRISSDLKSELSKVSQEQGLSMSVFIRQALEKAVSQSQDVKSNEPDIESQVRKMMYAAATIASIDTGIPMDKCIAQSIHTLESMDFDLPTLLQMSRDEKESNYLKLQQKIKTSLNLSDRAIAFISLLFSTYFSMVEFEHVFDLSPLSVITLERIRHELSS